MSSSAGIRRIARIDLAVIERGLTRCVTRDDSVVVDLRSDAYGHGVERVTDLALQCGVRAVLVSPAEREGLPGAASRIMTADPGADAPVTDEIYGLEDGATESAMTLVGEVVAVKPVEGGVGVSYGYTYRTPRPTTLALVALGYADGVPRLASNRAEVVIESSRLPLVGRVAMDQFVVDCGEITPTLGADATLFGSAAAGLPTASEWGAWTDRSAHDITAGIGQRVARRYS